MEDYTVKELHAEEVSSYRYEVMASIDVDQEKDPLFLPLARALIQTGALAQGKDLMFQVVDGRVHVVFRVTAPTGNQIYPKIGAAKNIFIATVTEALRLKRIVDAFELVDPVTGGSIGALSGNNRNWRKSKEEVLKLQRDGRLYGCNLLQPSQGEK